jgi:hypothetical protein
MTVIRWTSPWPRRGLSGSRPTGPTGSIPPLKIVAPTALPLALEDRAFLCVVAELSTLGRAPRIPDPELPGRCASRLYEPFPLLIFGSSYESSRWRETRCSMSRDVPSGLPIGGAGAGTKQTSARPGSVGRPFSWGAHAAFCCSRLD